MTSAFERVLLPYDGSEAASVALNFAIDLAHADVTFTIVNVVDETPAFADAESSLGYVGDPASLLDALDNEGRSELAVAAERCAAAHVNATTELLHERAVPGIVGAAESHHADLIVMGTHAREGLARASLGSTTEGVLRSCAVPVLVVRKQTHVPEPHEPFRRALVAIDGSEPAEAALALALRLAQTEQTQLMLCNVVPTEPAPKSETPRRNDLVDAALAYLRAANVDAESTVVEGHPANAIIAAAAWHNVDLIVVGSHGRRGLQRVLLGSVAEWIARHSQIPVLIVRTPPRAA